jgi:sulfopyruvate decarboxylase subunit beta
LEFVPELTLVGKLHSCLIQTTGLANSLNAVFSLILNYKIPLLILASYRGYYKEQIEAQKPLGQNIQEILTAAHIEHYLIKNKLDDVETACNEVRNQGKLVVCLLSPELFEK